MPTDDQKRLAAVRRDALVAHLTGKGWLLREKFDEWYLRQQWSFGARTAGAQLAADLAALVREGRIEKRAVEGMRCKWGQMMAYRVTT